MVLLMLLCTLLIEYAHESRGYFVMDNNSLVIFSDDINAEFLVYQNIARISTYDNVVALQLERLRLLTWNVFY